MLTDEVNASDAFQDTNSEDEDNSEVEYPVVDYDSFQELKSTVITMTSAFDKMLELVDSQNPLSSEDRELTIRRLKNLTEKMRESLIISA